MPGSKLSCIERCERKKKKEPSGRRLKNSTKAIIAFSGHSDSAVQREVRGWGKKGGGDRGRGREEGMPAYPTPCCFSCSHLFVSSLQSERLE